MSAEKKRIGIIGYGQIGSYVYEQITQRPEMGLEIAFVYNRSPERVKNLPDEVILDELEDFEKTNPDLVVELAHSDITREYGQMILESTDYLILSVTVMADRELEEHLLKVCQKNGTCLYIPHGGVIGLDTINEGREVWDEVRGLMRKNPKNLDFSRTDIDSDSITSTTVLYEGPVRDICPKFPRNVNTLAALALGGIGFDRTQATLIADPSLDVAIVEVYAYSDEVKCEIKRIEPIKGVTGTFILTSTLQTIKRVEVAKSGIQIC